MCFFTSFLLNICTRMNLNAALKFNGITWNVVRNHFTPKRCAYYSTSVENKIKFLKQLTDCTLKEATKAIMSKRVVDKIDKERIVTAYSLLQDLGLKTSDIARNVSVLLIHPTTLQNHYMMLEEVGIKKADINSYIINRFYSIFKSSIKTLEFKGIIDKEIDINANYVRLLGLPHSMQSSVVKSSSLVNVHISNIRALLKWKSDGSFEDDDDLIARLNYKSARNILRNFDLLTIDFGITKERVLGCQTLLAVMPDNLENILKYVPTLADTEMKRVVQLWPKMLCNNYKSLIAIDNYLKEFGISTEVVLGCPAVYTLHPDNVYNRLKHIANDKDLLQWSYHPKFLNMVLYYKRVVERLNKLREMNMKCLSLFLLNSSEIHFYRHMEHLDKSNQYDLITFLCRTVSADPKQIRNKLKKHPYWLFIPHKEILETLLFIKGEGFTDEEIISSIIVVLYPKDVVQEELANLYSKTGFQCCRDEKTGNLRRQNILPLLLYSIELPYHFSKDAIWAYRNKETDLSKSTG